MERYMFFNSTSSDRRRHQAQDMADYWESFLTTGIINKAENVGLAVTSDGTNMNVNISDGRAVVKGHLYLLDGGLSQTLEQTSVGTSRIDRIVLRLDRRIENRYIRIFVKRGTQSSNNPQPPALQRDDDIYELSLASITVVGGQSVIQQENIVDDRLNESLAGLAQSLGRVPTDIYNEEFRIEIERIQNQWNDFFNGIINESFVTQTEYKQKNLQVNRQLANLNAIADIDNRAIGNTGKFYDLFDGTNEYSVAQLERSSGKTNSQLNIGNKDLSVSVISGNFNVGDEITIIGIETSSSTEANVYNREIMQISGNVLTLNEALDKTLLAGAFVCRSMTEGDIPVTYGTVDAWNGTLSKMTLLNNSRGITQAPNITSFTDDKLYMSDGFEVYKRNASGMYDKVVSNTNATNGFEFIGGDFLVNITSDQNYNFRYSIYKINRSNDTLTPILTSSGLNTSYSQIVFSSKPYIKDNKIVLLLAFSTSIRYSIFDLTTNTESTGTLNYTNSLNPSGIDYDRFRDVFVITRDSDYSILVIKFDINSKTIITNNLISTGSSYNVGYIAINEKYGFIGGTNSAAHKPKIIEWDASGVNGTIDNTPFQNNEPSTSVNRAENFSFSRNGLYMYYYYSRGLYSFVNGKLSLIRTLTAAEAGTNGSFNKFSDNLFVSFGTASGSITREELKGTTDFDVGKSILRYKTNKPIKNLAGWLITNEQPTSVQADLSLVNANEPESYQPLTVTQNGNEYEFLETQNLYTKDKTTLKLTIEGTVNLNKLLGAVE